MDSIFQPTCGVTSTRDDDGRVWTMAGICGRSKGHIPPHDFIRPQAAQVVIDSAILAGGRNQGD
jgi:hypothetical protein